MKRLTNREVDNLFLEKAQEVVRDFGKFMESAIPIYAFESELPWEKTHILLSLLKALDTTTDEGARSSVRMGILYLNDIIPNPDQYSRRKEAADKIRLIMNDLKNGLTTEEIVEKYRAD